MNKYAYVTLMSTENYLYSLIGLMYSWKQTESQYPFYVVVTEHITDFSKNILKKIGYNIIEEQEYIPKKYWELLQQYEFDDTIGTGNSHHDLEANGWQHGWTKLKLFNYTQFDKVIYIDADCIILQNMDDLFDAPHFSSVPEINSFHDILHFNSCFLVIQPNNEEYTKLIQMAEESELVQKREGFVLITDMDLINDFKKDWIYCPELHLPMTTCMNWYMLETNFDNQTYLFNNISKLRAIHLVGDKPWLMGKSWAHDIHAPQWQLFKQIYLYYIDFLNYCLTDIYNKGIATLVKIN